jgi:periplasmic copper chaperone A
MALLPAQSPAQSPVQTAGVRVGNLLIANARSQPTPPAVAVGVAYFSITNLGSRADRLVALSSPIASAVEMHATHEAHRVVEMRAVAALECPAGVTIKIEPGGLHVMLMGLTRPLIAGTTFDLSLQFRDAGIVALKVPVENAE